jgi:hypothetical protein
MTKKAAIVLALAMLAVVAWGMFLDAGSTRIIVNGQEITGPLNGAIGSAGFLVGMIALFCAAIFLLFVFAGIGVLVLGALIAAGLMFSAFAFPFALAALLPLALVWGFIALMRR